VSSDPFVHRGVSLPLYHVGTFSKFAYHSHPYMVGGHSNPYTAAYIRLPAHETASQGNCMHTAVSTASLLHPPHVQSRAETGDQLLPGCRKADS
jgi:hypothetical protein